MKVGLILAVLLAARVSAAQDQPDELAQIRAQLAAQQEQIRQLEAELHKPKEEEQVVAARRLGLTLFAFIQADGVIYNQASSDQLTDSTGDPLNQTRFLIRRAHVGTTLSRGILAGTLELEASTVTDPLVRVFESSFTVRWPGEQPIVAGTLGLYRVPFGYENV